MSPSERKHVLKVDHRPFERGTMFTFTVDPKSMSRFLGVNSDNSHWERIIKRRCQPIIVQSVGIYEKTISVWTMSTDLKNRKELGDILEVIITSTIGSDNT